ncbi:MAG: zf-HC2 domain-containing protein [Desulfobacterales bacterium]|nr:MAG: zf-HC2 domain-containing protein [Desulfobacterales bacterium]
MESDNQGSKHCDESHDYKHCLEMFKRLSEYLDNELDEVTCKEIEHHVKQCVPCFSCLQTLKRTVDLCKQTANKPVPRAFSEKLKELSQNMPKTTNP